MPNPPKHQRKSAAQAKPVAASQPKKRPASAASSAPAGAPDSAALRVAWASLHVLVFLVPLAVSNLTFLKLSNLPITYDQFDIAKVFVQRACALIAAGAYGWHMLMHGGRVRRTKVDYLILAFIGWVAVTTATSISPATAFFGKYRRFEGWLSFVTYAVVFFLVVQYADRPSRIRSLARTLFYSGVFVSAYGVMQYLGKDLIQWGQLPFEARRAFATYGNPDLLGGFIIFSLAISMALALSEEDGFWRAVYWGGFLLTVWCWLVAYVRGAWIAGIVVLAIMAFAAVWAKARLHPVDWFFVAGIAAVLAVFLAESLRNPNPVLNVAKRAKSIFEFSGGSGRTRLQIWQAAVDAIKARPIFGFGADTFRLVFPKYKPYEYVAAAGYLSVADNVHNYPLQLTSGVGIPGFLMLYGTFAWTAIQSFKASFARGKQSERLVLAGFWAALVGYLVHLMFGLSVTGSTIFLWISMAIVLSPLATSFDFKPGGWGGAVAVALLAACLLGSIGNVVYMQADHQYLIGRIASQGVNRINAIEQAIKLNPYNDMYRAELGLAWQDNAVNSIFAARQAQEKGEDPAALLQQAKDSFLKAEQAFKDTIRFVPTEYDNYVFLSNLYNFGADYIDPAYRDKAIEVARKGAQEVEPFGPAIRFQLAMALSAKGDIAGAIKELKFASDMDPGYADVAGLLGDLYRRQGDLAGARAAYQRALAVSPGTQKYIDALAQVDASMGSKPATP